MEIKLESIAKVYEGSTSDEPALVDITARVESGEFFFLLGPSGCGKTTLLKLIAGLLHPTAGQIYFDGEDVTELSVDKRDTALVFQGYALWPHMTVVRNVEFGPKMQGRDGEERHRIAMEQLNRVQMGDYLERKPNQLSGGQQQRVALARALAARSGCLLLDEPLSNLDARLRLHMRGELRTLVKTSGVTAIYVTHDQKEALSMADRIAVMNAGQIVQVGTPEELYNRPATRFVADFLGEANFLDGTVVESATVESAFGKLRTSGDHRFETGGEVTCCVRPEHIGLETEEPRSDGANHLPATVVSSIYLGEIRQFTCALGEGSETWRASMLSHEAPAVGEGQNVWLQFSADHVALVAR